MRESFSPAAAQDFRQRYRNTAGKYIKENGDPLWVWIQDVGDGVSFVDTHGNDFFATGQGKAEFEFTQVPQGWYNTSKRGPVMFSRQPARQYQRGISRANTTIIGSTGAAVGVSLDIVADAMTFDGKFGGKWPWALSRFFMINERRQVWFLNTIIGELDNTTIYVDNTCPVVQELGDTLRRNNLPFTIHAE